MLSDKDFQEQYFTDKDMKQCFTDKDFKEIKQCLQIKIFKK
jgi:hypothetical protein